MRQGESASCFFSHFSIIRSSQFRRLLIPAIGLTVCLSAARSFAQQHSLPRQAESAKVIRLRQQWFYQQRAYPNKHIPAGARFKAYEQLLKMQAAQRSRQQKQQTTTTLPSTSTTFATALSSTSWTLIGPQPTTMPFAFNPVSGRVTALAVDPTNSNIIYLGGAEGGVWKTTDGGTTWTPLTDNQPSLAVGSIAIDPENPQTIYVGTGEEDFALYNYAGAGILKSTDGGSTWTQMSAPFAGPFGSQSPDCGGAYIGSLAVDPGNSQIILAGVLFPCSSGSGIYRTYDGGAYWTEVLGTSQAPYLVTSLLFDPVNSNNVYAAVGASSSSSNDGIWKSTNAGVTWTLSNGSGATAFPGSNAARISLAIAPSSPTTLYAGAASTSSGSTSLLGVYKTTNGGAAWTQLTSAPQYCSPPGGPDQCYFDNVVAVAPNNPNIVLLGGSETVSNSGYAGTLYLSLDGGSTWKDITNDTKGNGIHPDMHAIAFSQDGSKMFAGNDGGVWSTSLSNAGAGTWTDLNQTLALTQFYPGMSINPVDPNEAFAGTQDNGIQQYSGNPTWDYIGCGDGGQTAFNYSDLNTLFLSCAYLPPNTNPDGSTADFLFKLTLSPPSAVAADNGIDGTDRGAFIPPLTMDPSNPDTLYFGTDRLYQTTDGAANWKAISSDLTSGNQGILSTISAIAVAPSDSNTVYVGTGDGRLWMTSTAGQGYCCSIVNNGTAFRFVTAIAVDPANAQTAYATDSGYSGFGDTLGHVFETTNAGSSWTDISGNLPNVPVNDIVVDPDFANTLYIGTDVGVFETTDGGTTWEPLGSGLPAVVIMSLKLHHATRILRAASYGRSAWDIQLPAPVGPSAVLSTPTLDFAPQEAGTTSPAQTVTLTNNSSTALTISSIAASSNFTETNTCGSSLAAGANCTLSVTFTPTTFGNLTGSVTISDNAASGSLQTINLSGKGFSGAVSLSPTSLSFGNQLVGTTSAAQTVTLTNTSSTPLTIEHISEPHDFTYTTDCPIQPSTLAGGTSCHINFIFAPYQMGTISGQSLITDSANDSPQSIILTANGIAPVVTFSPSYVDFGDQMVGTSKTLTATLTNTGTADLLISSISNSANTTPNPYTESDDCPRSPTAIPVQGSCTINVTFAPTAWGLHLDGVIDVPDNQPYTNDYLGLSASAYSGAATYSPTSLDFGAVAIGQTSTKSITLLNSGTLPLYIGGISGGASGDGTLSQANDCPLSPSSLAAGASCTLTYSFTPTGPGTMSVLTYIRDSAFGFLQTLTTTATGASPDFSITPPSGSASDVTVSQGGTASYLFSITPLFGFNQTVSFGCTGAPSLATCTVAPGSVTLDGTHSQNVKVTVTTTAASLAPPGPKGGPPAPGGFAFHNGWFALLWLLMMATLAVAFRRRKRCLPVLAGAVLLAALAMSCGGGGGSSGGGGGGGGTGTNPGTPAGTYTLTVTGTSGSLKHQTTVTLTVK